MFYTSVTELHRSNETLAGKMVIDITYLTGVSLATEEEATKTKLCSPCGWYLKMSPRIERAMNFQEKSWSHEAEKLNSG